MDQKESNVANTIEQFFVYVDRGRNRPIKNTVRSTASQKYFLKEHHSTRSSRKEEIAH